MVTLVVDAWDEIHNRIQHGGIPVSWQAFYEEYQAEIDQITAALLLPGLTGHDMKQAACKKKLTTQPGPDGWLLSELLLLPDEFLDLLAKMFEDIEAGQEWLESLLHACEVLLDRGQGPHPLSQRPIILLDVVIRCWSSLRSPTCGRLGSLLARGSPRRVIQH